MDVTLSTSELPSDHRNSENYKTLLSVIVKDSGPGISEEDQMELFKPFTTLERTRDVNPKAVGIGLYTCKLICERLGGDICCFSDGPDTGTTFEFRI